MSTTLEAFVAREDAVGRYDEPIRYTVARHEGVAWWYDRPETEPDEDTEWSGIENETGRVLMVMVGDDRRYAFDPDDCTPIAPDDYCHECGQVGCTADGRDRS